MLRNVLYQAVDMFFYILYILILIRVFLSWIPMSRSNPIIGLVCSFTDPILEPIRGMIAKSPLGNGLMIDFSPIIALFVMNIVKSILLTIILTLL